MALQFWALVASANAFLGSLQDKVEVAKQLWVFLNLFPDWLNYQKQVGEKEKALIREMESLCSVEQDNLDTLRNEELQPGKKRKREVETWFRNVEAKKNEVDRIRQQIVTTKYLWRPLLNNPLEKTIEEVKDLFQHGKSFDGLVTHDPTSKVPLLTSNLVGRGSTLETFREWLNDDNVSRIGIYGKVGVGKTALLTVIHNQILEGNNPFERIYLITVAEPDISKLQDAIASQVKLDLSDEEDRRKRAARLHRALTLRTKCIIILDDIAESFALDDVGIPNEGDGCKLILSTQTMRVCQRMDCHQTLEIEPLSEEEALALFKEKLSLRRELEPEIEQVMELIVKECRGLPSTIIEQARGLIGEHEINEWRDALEELKKSMIR
ncbi:hypothetical protein UlMin_003436 [Ulmus minor]